MSELVLYTALTALGAALLVWSLVRFSFTCVSMCIRAYLEERVHTDITLELTTATVGVFLLVFFGLL